MSNTTAYFNFPIQWSVKLKFYWTQMFPFRSGFKIVVQNGRRERRQWVCSTMEVAYFLRIWTRTFLRLTETLCARTITTIYGHRPQEATGCLRQPSVAFPFPIIMRTTNRIKLIGVRWDKWPISRKLLERSVVAQRLLAPNTLATGKTQVITGMGQA